MSVSLVSFQEAEMQSKCLISLMSVSCLANELDSHLGWHGGVFSKTKQKVYNLKLFNFMPKETA